MIDNIQNERRNEKKKAKNVVNQKILHDNFLRIRILFQKPLHILNKFPQHEIFPEFLKQEKIEKNCKVVESELTDILSSLIDLQSVINYFK
jgi:hypothetical protein